MRFTTSLYPIAGLLALGLAGTARTASADDHPTYPVGVQPNGTVVMSTNQTVTPTGILIDLGSPVRAKAVALNPAPQSHTGAVLLMGASAPVQVFDLVTGEVRQTFLPAQDSTGSYGGIAYSADGNYLFFSQDSSNLAIARVAHDGKLSEFQHLALPPDTSIPLYTSGTAYPGGVAVSADGKSAYVLLNQNNTLGVVDLSKSTPVLKKQIRVGNVPNSVVLVGDYAYVSNEGGRVALKGDFTDISSGTPIVVNKLTNSASTGTVSVVDLKAGKVVAEIPVGLHPTGMTLSGSLLFVANAYNDSVSIINTTDNRVIRTIHLYAPLPVPSTDASASALGMSPTGIVVDGSVMYVTLATANAIAVVDLSGGLSQPVLGYIPTASFPTTIALDAARRQLVVSNDKGIGTQGSLGSAQGLSGYNSHQDTGTVNLVPLPSMSRLAELTQQVYRNNHWDLTHNVQVGPEYANPNAKPKAIPDHIGEPSLIKHVFLIIKENRTYDQIFGDVAKGNGDASLAVFGAATPNQHALVQRFPLLDNTYAPARQSADGHPWIVSSIAGYADEIQSPDWVRSYPGGNSNDSMVYMPHGFLWQAAMRIGLKVRMFGEWSKAQTFPTGSHYSWTDWYNYAQFLEGKLPRNPTTITPTTDTESTTVTSAAEILDPHYPSFNTGIPDQYRVDYWLPIFNKYEATNSLPAFTIMWLPDDHTSGVSAGFPLPAAAQADNDLALGRIVEAVSHSKDWASTAMFVEEDDAQNGVDHVDGHRQPAFVISPYALQNGGADHTTYTAANINRTIEQILGMTPLTQFDLVASPMTTAFTDTPNAAPFTHLAPTVALDTFPPAANHASTKLEGAWILASGKWFKGKTTKPDMVDSVVLNHMDWYSAVNFGRPYPGETKVKWPNQFHVSATGEGDGDDY